MARKDKDIKPTAAPEAPAVQEAATAYQDGMVLVRSKGGLFIDPYTHIRYEAEPQRVLVTSWVQAQLDAGKLEIIPG